MLGRGLSPCREAFSLYTASMNTSNVEIVYDPYEEALCTGLQLGPEHKIMPDGDWIQHVRRETGKKNLFVYHHQYTGMFVLAAWIYPPSERDAPVCLELETMNTPPDRGGWIPTIGVKLRCRPVDEETKMMKDRLKAAADARKEERIERGARKADQVAHLRRKGMDVAASSLDASKVHYGKESQLTEDLNRMAKGRTITHG